MGIREGPVLQVMTMSGHIYSWKAPFGHLKVIDVKESLASYVNMPATRQALFYKDALLDDARVLEAYVPADELKLAESGGHPVQLSLLKVAPTTIIVPDDCRTISEAVAQLSRCGGVVEVVAPPTVAHDVIEICRPDISIIASGHGGIDARKARIYIKTHRPSSIGASPAQHVCIHGLLNLDRISIIECSHVGSIAFRDCDLLPYREMHIWLHPSFQTPPHPSFQTPYWFRSSCRPFVSNYYSYRHQTGFVFNRPIKKKLEKHRRGSRMSSHRTLYTSILESHPDVTPLQWPSNCAPLTYEQEGVPQIRPLRVRMLERSYAEACHGL